MRELFLFANLSLFVLTVFTQQKDFPRLTGPYLGQKQPGMTPEVFAPGSQTTLSIQKKGY